MCGTIRHPDASDFWSMKIAALFHDPPLKPWVKQHQDFAAKYLPNPVKNLKVGDVKVEELVRRHHDAKGLVKALAFADWCSSSVERPIAELVRSPKEVGFIHPLSGLELGETGVSVMHSMSELQARDIAERMMNTLSECIKRFNLLGKVDVEHVKATYLMLWRCLEGAWWKAVSEVLEDEAKKLIPPPADTRTPTHTVFDHVESTSALAPCSSSGDALNAALVSFDVGGIQPFISASRKTSDLWAASWLVSLLGWGALRRVCEVLGPDAVVFPYLKGIPFADVWIIRKTIRSSESKAKFSDVLKYILEVEGLSEEEWYEKFMLSLIPPTAALIVPKHLVDEVKRCLIEGLEECWRNLVSIAWKYLNEKFECSVAEVRERWGRQTKEPPIGPVRVVHTEFPEKSEEIENFLKEHGWLIPKKLYETLEKLVQKLWELKKNGELRYPSRPSIVYGAIFAINAAKMASLTREFEVPIEPSPLEERGAEIKERCNMCGVRNPLFLRKEEWRRLAEEDIIEWDYRHDRGEYLCSICLIKRLLSRKKIIEKVLEEIVGLPRNIAGNVAKRGGFPSTSDFAAALFKHTLAELIVECRISQTELEELNKKAQKLVNKIREFAGKSGIRTLVSRQPPMIERDIKEIERRYGKSAEPLLALLRFMGEFLDPDTYYRLLQRRRLSEDEKRALRNTAKRIGKDLKEIVEVVKKCVRRYRPKEGGTPLRIKPLSIGVSDTFAIVSSDGDYMGEWIQGLRLPPLKLSVPPSLRDDFEYRYQSLSGMHKILSPATHIAISRSLLWYAKEVVPRVVEESLGAVVYAGGDDVLALVPPTGALTVAQRLSEEFMREWDNRLGHIVIGMGHRASCSAGLVFAHYMHHLAHAISRVRELQEKAKEDLEDGEHGKGAVKAEFYGRTGPIAKMSKALHWIEPWNHEELDAFWAYVTPFYEGDITWVGVSVLAKGFNLVNGLFGRSKPKPEFFSPLILADQLGAISRGGIGELEEVEISRRCFYELTECITDLEKLKKLNPLIALMRRSLIRHTRPGEFSQKVANLVVWRLERLREFEDIKSVIELSTVAEHAYEFSVSSLSRFRVVSWGECSGT